jgi:hypothetical protein
MAHALPCLSRELPRELSPQWPDDVVERCAGVIEAEYREWPALSLTKAQMERLWDIDQTLCGAAVDRLVQRHRLRCRANGSYVRAMA